MRMMQTRRGFLGGIAAAGAAGLIRAPRAESADGPLETTAPVGEIYRDGQVCVTRRWREPDSNHRSRSCHSETAARKSEPLTRFRPETAMLA
jgi:hypothetical protein